MQWVLADMRLTSLALCLLLAACGAPSNKPAPAPLPKPERQATVQLRWDARVGGKTDFRFVPAHRGQWLAVAGGGNSLALLEAQSGRERWSITLKKPLAGGVGLGEQLLAVGTVQGELLTFDLQGKAGWTAKLSTELIAPPVVAGDRVLARTNDVRLSAFNAQDGQLVWTYQRATPALILRNFAAPTVSNGVVYLGMAGGKLAALSLADGRQIWETAVATPRGASELERITDIVSAPVVDGSQVCAAAFQGRVACLNARDGALLWARDLSSWAGLALDKEHVYVSDDRGYVNALERATGRSLWRQEKLAGREISGSAFDGKQVFVGDFEGYVHVLDASDGALVAQIDTDGGRIAAAPQGMDGQVLVQTQRGGLFSLSVK